MKQVWKRFWLRVLAEITFQKKAVHNLKANKFTLFDIIGGAKLKKHYTYVYEINEVDGNDLEVTEHKAINSAKSKFLMIDNEEILSLSKNLSQSCPF